MNTALSAALAVKPAIATTSGVRVSCRPRSSPVAAIKSSIPGIPQAAIARYSTAASVTAGAAPNAAASGRAVRAPTTARSAPSARASHMPSMPARIAPARSPAPRRRATVGVVA